MSGKAWVIIIIIVLALFGVGFLYFYSPLSHKNETGITTPQTQPSYNPPVTNNTYYTNTTPQPYKGFYNGVLNGTLYGYLYSGISANQYNGLFNGTYNGYGWIDNQPVFFSTTIYSGSMSGYITGEHRGNEFRGNILANVNNVEMNGTVTYLYYEQKEPLTFWTLFKKIWWILLIAIAIVIIVWIIARFSGGGEYELHDIIEIDKSIRPLLEGEPLDREIKRFVRSRPIPNATKPKYHQILYECKMPAGEYILVDCKYARVLKIHTNISGPDIKKQMDETTFTSGPGDTGFGYGGGYYGGYGGYGRRYGSRRTTRRTPPPSEGMGEYGSEEL